MEHIGDSKSLNNWTPLICAVPMHNRTSLHVSYEHDREANYKTMSVAGASVKLLYQGA